MSLHIRCPQCGNPLTAPESQVGKVAKCPQCGELLRLPVQDAIAAKGQGTRGQGMEKKQQAADEPSSPEEPSPAVPERAEERGTQIEERSNAVGTRTRRTIASACVVFLAVLMVMLGVTLYPPWCYTYQRPGISQATEPAPRAFLFIPPPPKVARAVCGVRLDYGRLLLEWVVILMAGGVAFVAVIAFPLVSQSPAVRAFGGKIRSAAVTVWRSARRRWRILMLVGATAAVALFLALAPWPWRLIGDSDQARLPLEPGPNTMLSRVLRERKERAKPGAAAPAAPAVPDQRERLRLRMDAFLQEMKTPPPKSGGPQMPLEQWVKERNKRAASTPAAPPTKPAAPAAAVPPRPALSGLDTAIRDAESVLAETKQREAEWQAEQMKRLECSHSEWDADNELGCTIYNGSDGVLEQLTFRITYRKNGGTAHRDIVVGTNVRSRTVATCYVDAGISKDEFVSAEIVGACFRHP